MKTVFIFITLLTGLPLWHVEAEEDANSALSEIAASKRDAVLKLRVRGLRGYELGSLGVFISGDGLALVDLKGIATKKEPTIVAADGVSLKLGRILEVFPKQELALMKFDHTPKLWLKLAPAEPEVNETIALVLLSWDDPWDSTIPPVAGPVMAKRSGMTPNSRVTRFTRVLSLGSSLSTAQHAWLGPGRFAIDSEGRLVAFTNGIAPEILQTFILLAPVVGLKSRIDTLARGGKDIGFPLPESSNPLDPAIFDRDFHPKNIAKRQQDWPEYQRLLEGLRMRYPDSGMLRREGQFLRHPGIQRNLAKPDGDPLLDSPEPQSDDPVAQQVEMWAARAEFFANNQKFEDSINARKAAIALSPNDYPEDRFMLGHLYAHLGRLDEAEKLYREVYSCFSDDIGFVESFVKLLDQRNGSVEEATKLADRVLELEKIYSNW